MRPLEIDRQKTEPDGGGRPKEVKDAAARRTRGGSPYQHSLSARRIKSSGRERSRSDEDLLSSLERLERATRLPSIEDEESSRRRHTGAFGRHDGERKRREGSDDVAEQRVCGPRFEW